MITIRGIAALDCYPAICGSQNFQPLESNIRKMYYSKRIRRMPEKKYEALNKSDLDEDVSQTYRNKIRGGG